MNQRNPHQQHNVSTMDNIHQTIPRKRKSTDSGRNQQPDSQAPLLDPSFGIHFNQSQHKSQQRQHQRQHPHPQQRRVYNPSPNARASTQQRSNNHNHHPNSKVAGASTSTNQLSSNYSNYYPSGIPSVLARSIDEDLLLEGRRLVDPKTRQAIDDADRRREQSRLRNIKFQAKEKEKADANNLALKRDGLRALENIHNTSKGGVVEIVEYGLKALENMHKNSTRCVVEIVEDGLRALENMHKNSTHCNTHTTNNYGGRVVEIVEGLTPNEQDEDQLNCNEDHNEEDHDHDYDYEEDRTNRDEGAPIAENHPNENVDRDSSTSARYRSRIPVFRKRGGLKDDIIYSLSVLNEGPNDNVNPHMQRSDDANPFRVDMFQRETLMAVSNLLYMGEMPDGVIPNGEDTTYITRFCDKYEDPLHDFIYGRGVFDFVQEEKKTGLDHTYQIINREYSQFGNTAHINGRIKKAFAYASTLPHERRFELSPRRNGGTPSRRHGTTPPPPPRGRSSNGNSSNKRHRTSSP